MKHYTQYKYYVCQAKKYSDRIIAEQFVDGREMTCGVFSVNNIVKTLPHQQEIVLSFPNLC